jgi:hypothetical protein
LRKLPLRNSKKWPKPWIIFERKWIQPLRALFMRRKNGSISHLIAARVRGEIREEEGSVPSVLRIC